MPSTNALPEWSREVFRPPDENDLRKFYTVSKSWDETKLDVNIGAPGFLTDSETLLVRRIIGLRRSAFSITMEEMGCIGDHIAQPYRIETAEHEAYQGRQFKVPDSMKADVIA